MAMTKLIDEVTQLVDKEYDRAAEQHGKLHHSAHEAYAVIKEELEEAQEQVEHVDDKLNTDYWRGVMADSDFACRHIAKQIKEHAIKAAGEMIQVAAMAEKALKGFGKDVKPTDAE